MQKMKNNARMCVCVCNPLHKIVSNLNTSDCLSHTDRPYFGTGRFYFDSKRNSWKLWIVENFATDSQSRLVSFIVLGTNGCRVSNVSSVWLTTVNLILKRNYIPNAPLHSMWVANARGNFPSSGGITPIEHVHIERQTSLCHIIKSCRCK